ncbi:MAG: hypothetical protein Q9168_006330, partial [Polycauliona sp. 1 TL-2023]
MKFINTITALAVLLSMTAFAIVPSIPPPDADEVTVIDAPPSTDSVDSTPANATAAVAGVDFVDTPLTARDLEERASKQSDLDIVLYVNKGCVGAQYRARAIYDNGYAFPIKSYKTSRTLKLGETIS